MLRRVRALRHLRAGAGCAGALGRALRRALRRRRAPRLRAAALALRPLLAALQVSTLARYY